jgi:hypothetical protein
MRQLTALTAALSVPMFLFGCQQDNSKTKEALQKIDKRLSAIERSIARGARPGAARGRGRRRAERPPGPNPATVYSVAVGDSATVGPKNAKVTIVEAFEFA